MSVEVEPDVFSGRPNPVWTLRAEEVTEFRARVSELRETESKPWSNDLGYRGILVRVRQGHPREMRIYDGIVEVHEEGAPSRTFLQDANRSLERWLLATGTAFVADAVRAVIEADLGDQPN